MHRALALYLALSCGIPHPQEPADEVVARFTLGDRASTVTRVDLALELARRHRNTDAGREALELLIDRALVTEEARRAHLTPGRREIGQRVGEIEDALRAQGMTLADLLASKNLSRSEFERDYVALSVAHERLVMKSLELESRREVTPEMLELWLREAKTRIEVVEDPAKLPAGIVARVGERSFGLREFGSILLQNVPREELPEHVRRIVLRRALAHAAAEAGIEVSVEDTRAEIARRKQRIESDPRFGGASYESWLMQTRGMRMDELERSTEMVATVQQQKLVDLRHPRADLERRLREDRAGVLRRHGERRSLSVIVLRARETPDELIPRGLDAARDELVELRQEIADRLPFDRAARIHSEDPGSKAKGGAIGAFFRGSTSLPDAVLEAAFATPHLGVSEPIRVPQGYLLLKVTGIEPAPDDDELIRRLREELANRLLIELLDAAKIETDLDGDPRAQRR